MLTQREPELTFNDAHNAPHSSSNYYRSLPHSLFSRPLKTPEKWALIFLSIKTQYKSNRTNTDKGACLRLRSQMLRNTRWHLYSILSLSLWKTFDLFLFDRACLSKLSTNWLPISPRLDSIRTSLTSLPPRSFWSHCPPLCWQSFTSDFQTVSTHLFLWCAISKKSAKWQCPVMHVWWSVVRLNATEGWSNGRTNLLE